MSARPPKANIRQREWNVRFAPKADPTPAEFSEAGLARFDFPDSSLNVFAFRTFESE